MVPQQALFSLNSPFVIEQAKGLAARPEVAGVAESAGRVTELYRIVLQRNPSADELQGALEFVEIPKEDSSQLTNWEQLAQILLSSNELMYVD